MSEPIHTSITANCVKLADPAIVTDSGATITLSDATHNGRVLLCTHADAVAVTIPAGLAAGFSCMVIQSGAGPLSFVQGSSATVNSYLGLLSIAGQHGAASVVWTAADVFNLSGNLA